jgi:alkanesulfonate monooxygenase SsuD/methylene tetrahydromethanopterin reductase-like flavin-dependent oxidoreductase (luciferase family)
MLDDGVHVEQLGYDSIWLPDHYYFERAAGIETYPDVWTLLTALAVKTERVLLGTNVLAATFRHPALLAKMAGALQELADGRVVLGLGAGNQPNEHAAFGLDFEHRIGRFKEYLPILTGLLRGETVTYEGRYFIVREASLRTVVPSVPLWIASGGPQMHDLTAHYASGWNIAGGGTDLAANQRLYDAFSAACVARGRDPKSFQVGKMSFIGVSTSAAAARTMLDELASRSKTDPEVYLTRNLVGTPDQIADKLRAYTAIGVTHHIFNIATSEQWPNYWDAAELLAREVIPRVRED